MIYLKKDVHIYKGIKNIYFPCILDRMVTALYVL